MSLTKDEIEKIQDRFYSEIKIAILWDDFFLTSSRDEIEIKKAKEEYWDQCNGSDNHYSYDLTLRKLKEIRDERFGLPDNLYEAEYQNLLSLDDEILLEVNKLIDYCNARLFRYNQIPDKVFDRCINIFIQKNKSKLVITVQGRWLPDFHYGGVSE